ncbi:hypothetical protein HNY73_000106 [Argiope bruennichi]|uniref:Uncharacterized protein n=1 Tax=Argiope bruennichi TaxID=94029 RepID=A0A8T0FWX6_ARGBR|nr:hypothetical protein HNY73_000106 [Argiope bruennichi]
MRKILFAVHLHKISTERYQQKGTDTAQIRFWLLPESCYEKLSLDVCNKEDYMPSNLFRDTIFQTSSCCPFTMVSSASRLERRGLAGTMSGERTLLMICCLLFASVVKADKFLSMDDSTIFHRIIAGHECHVYENIQLLGQPAHSPYLIPFENVFDALGRNLADRQCSPINKNFHINAQAEEWYKLP